MHLALSLRQWHVQGCFRISRCVPFDFGRPKIFGIMEGTDQQDSCSCTSPWRLHRCSSGTNSRSRLVEPMVVAQRRFSRCDGGFSCHSGQLRGGFGGLAHRCRAEEVMSTGTWPEKLDASVGLQGETCFSYTPSAPPPPTTTRTTNKNKNNQQPTTNNQQPTNQQTHNYQPTTNQPTTNQQPTNKHPTNNKQTTNTQQTTKTQQTTTNNNKQGHSAAGLVFVDSANALNCSRQSGNTSRPWADVCCCHGSNLLVGNSSLHSQRGFSRETPRTIHAS